MTSSEPGFDESAPSREPRETAAPEQGDSAEAVTDPSQPTGQRPGAESQAPADSELSDDLAKARHDLMVLTSDLQRLQAEYVNYKRRVDRDRELVKENSVYAAIMVLLPVLDDIDRAREHGEVEGGFKAVADSLDRAVAGMGLVKFGRPGDAFDPNMHEALMHAHSPDVTTTTCQLIISAGYRIGDRVVRPARVTVVDPEPIADTVVTDPRVKDGDIDGDIDADTDGDIDGDVDRHDDRDTDRGNE